MKRIARSLGVILFLGMGAVAQAATEFKVAGVNVSMADEGWTVSQAKGPPSLMGSGGIDATMPGDGRLLVKRDASGRVLAAVLVSATRPAPRPVTLGGACPSAKPQASVYEFKHGNPQGGPRTCAGVGGPFSSEGTLKHFKYLQEAQVASGFAAPEAAYFFWGYAIDQMGAMFNVEGWADVDFVGIDNVKPAGELGEGVKPEVAAWADAFGKAIKQAHDGVFSRSTTLPPFQFSGAAASR